VTGSYVDDSSPRSSSRGVNRAGQSSKTVKGNSISILSLLGNEVLVVFLAGKGRSLRDIGVSEAQRGFRSVQALVYVHPETSGSLNEAELLSAAFVQVTSALPAVNLVNEAAAVSAVASRVAI